MTNEERFEQKYIPEPMSGCWLWIGCYNSSGYGSFWIAPRSVPASRASWLLNKGPVAPGFCVLHKCDNRTCVNPSHLFLGTNEDNIKDKVAKQRHYDHGRTHCKRGHLWIPENIQMNPKHGKRYCRLCHHVRHQLRKPAKAA